MVMFLATFRLSSHPLFVRSRKNPSSNTNSENRHRYRYTDIDIHNDREITEERPDRKRTTSDETDQDMSTHKNGRNARHKSKVGDRRMIMCCSVVKCMRQGVCGLSWWLCSGGCGACVQRVTANFQTRSPCHSGSHHVFFVHCSCMLERRLHKPSNSPSSVSSDADICVIEFEVLCLGHKPLLRDHRIVEQSALSEVRCALFHSLHFRTQLCSTKCALLRRAAFHWRPGRLTSQNPQEPVVLPDTLEKHSRPRCPRKASAPPLRCSYPLLARILDPPQSGPSSPPAIQLVPPSGDTAAPAGR